MEPPQNATSRNSQTRRPTLPSFNLSSFSFLSSLSLSPSSLSSAFSKSKLNVSSSQTGWTPDSSTDRCSACQSTFTLVSRKHHCRNCLLIFCGSCSSNVAYLSDPYFGCQRVCSECFSEILSLRTRSLATLIHITDKFPICGGNRDSSLSSSSVGRGSNASSPRSTSFASFQLQLQPSLTSTSSPVTPFSRAQSLSIVRDLCGIPCKCVESSGAFLDCPSPRSSARFIKTTTRWNAFLCSHPHLSRNDELRRLVRKGIPLPIRGHFWCLLAGARAKAQQFPNQYYDILCATAASHSTDATQLIEKDLTRTFPESEFYSRSDGIDALRRVLCAFSEHNQNIQYCQSMNFVAAFALLFMCEQDAFWLLATIVEDIAQVATHKHRLSIQQQPPPQHPMPAALSIQHSHQHIQPVTSSMSTTMFTPRQAVPVFAESYSYYQQDLCGVHVDLCVFLALAREYFPRICGVCDTLMVPLAPFALNWFLCFFSTSLPLEHCMALWDCVFMDGIHMLQRVALTLLKLNERRIVSCTSSEQLLQVLSTLRANISDHFSSNQLALSQSSNADNPSLECRTIGGGRAAAYELMRHCYADQHVYIRNVTQSRVDALRLIHLPHVIKTLNVHASRQTRQPSSDSVASVEVESSKPQNDQPTQLNIHVTPENDSNKSTPATDSCPALDDSNDLFGPDEAPRSSPSLTRIPQSKSSLSLAVCFPALMSASAAAAALTSHLLDSEDSDSRTQTEDENTSQNKHSLTQPEQQPSNHNHNPNPVSAASLESWRTSHRSLSDPTSTHFDGVDPSPSLPVSLTQTHSKHLLTHPIGEYSQPHSIIDTYWV